MGKISISILAAHDYKLGTYIEFYTNTKTNTCLIIWTREQCSKRQVKDDNKEKLTITNY